MNWRHGAERDMEGDAILIRIDPSRTQHYAFAMSLRLAVFLLLAVPVIAGKVPADAWQTGTLADITDEQRSVTIEHGYTYGSHHHSATRDAPYTIPHYFVETDTHVYEVIANGGDRRRMLPVTVNGPLKYALLGTDLYIQDEKGKEHKMTVLRKTLKARQPVEKK